MILMGRIKRLGIMEFTIDEAGIIKNELVQVIFGQPH
jgi:hypothetical protein